MTDTVTPMSLIFSAVTPSELEADGEYAVLIRESGDVDLTKSRPIRPLYARYSGEDQPGRLHRFFSVYDPDVEDFPTGYPLDRIIVLGHWDSAAHPSTGARGQTWRQLAEHAWSQVQRQRRLAERLTALGVPRHPETYQGGQVPVVHTSMHLSYDEVESLLDLAEQAKSV